MVTTKTAGVETTAMEATGVETTGVETTMESGAMGTTAMETAMCCFGADRLDQHEDAYESGCGKAQPTCYTDVIHVGLLLLLRWRPSGAPYVQMDLRPSSPIWPEPSSARTASR